MVACTILRAAVVRGRFRLPELSVIPHSAWYHFCSSACGRKRDVRFKQTLKRTFVSDSLSIVLDLKPSSASGLRHRQPLGKSSVALLVRRLSIAHSEGSKKRTSLCGHCDPQRGQERPTLCDFTSRRSSERQHHQELAPKHAGELTQINGGNAKKTYQRAARANGCGLYTRWS